MDRRTGYIVRSKFNVTSWTLFIWKISSRTVFIFQNPAHHSIPQEQVQSPAVRLPVFERAAKVAQGELGAGGTEKAVVKVVKTIDPVRRLYTLNLTIFACGPAATPAGAG